MLGEGAASGVLLIGTLRRFFFISKDFLVYETNFRIDNQRIGSTYLRIHFPLVSAALLVVAIAWIPKNELGVVKRLPRLEA
jgi:hypothetical protein